MKKRKTKQTKITKQTKRFKLSFVSLFSFVSFFFLVFLPVQAQDDSLRAALSIEDPAARITVLEKFVRENTDSDQVQTAREALVGSWAQLGEVQLAENNIERATELFGNALAEMPEKITDKFFVETLIRIPMAVSVRGYRREAIGLAGRLEQRFAAEPLRLGSIGEFYLSIEAPSDAIRALETATKLSDDNALLHRILGAAYRMSLRLDDAIAEYQLTVKIDPADKRAYYELANLYRAHGAYDDAIALYLKQLEIDPNHAPSYKGLALVWLAKGDEEKTAAALNQARDLRGSAEEVTQDIYLQTQMAFHYLTRKKFKQARQAADAALLIEPRYAWARIAAAEVDMAEGKFFEAEKNLGAALRIASFPTLFFTLGKLYLIVEDFDGALEQFARAFEYSTEQGFSTRLGGVYEIRAEDLQELLSREHQAAIYLAESPTSPEQFKIISALVRFETRLAVIRKSGVSPDQQQLIDLDKAAMDFVDAENGRRPFRGLHIASRLAQNGIALGTAIELADISLGLADVAVGLDGSVRDYPNYDLEGRLAIFRGRALDAKGWAHFKSGSNREAEKVLTDAVLAYGSLPEGKRAIRHLATVKETLGELNQALDLYIAGYEPPADKSGSDVNRAVLEVIYRKVHGSLDGLDERLRRASTSTSDISSILNSAGKSESGPAQTSPETATAEPGAKHQTARTESPFRFNLPTQPKPAGADLFSTGGSSSPRQSPSAEKQPAISRSDPMFARSSRAIRNEPPPSEENPEPGKSRVAAKVEPPPTAPPAEPPVEKDTPRQPAESLPSIEFPVLSIQTILPEMTGLPPNPTSSAAADSFIELPDPEPAETLKLPAIDLAAIRKIPLRTPREHIIMTELRLNYRLMLPGVESPAPKVHTRRRRVTVPDDPPR